MLSELYRYTNENPSEADVQSTKKTLQYLEACNKLFEEGFLSHRKITDINSDVLKSISQGYEFFTSWINQLIENGTL